MKKIVFCFLSLSLFIGFANANNLIVDFESKSDVLSMEQNNILFEEARNINPDKVAEIENIAKDDEILKIKMLRSWLAEEIFNQYKSDFLEKFKQKSQKSGRKIKTSDDDTVMWLDRGDLDSRKCTNKDGDIICKYPDGFEECLYHVGENGTDKVVTFFCDDVAQNITEGYVLQLSDISDIKHQEESKDVYQNLFLHLIYTKEEYSNIHSIRNGITNISNGIEVKSVSNLFLRYYGKDKK